MADVRQALADGPASDSPLAAVYELCLACEAVGLAAVREHSRELDLRLGTGAEVQLEGMSWAGAVLFARRVGSSP